MFGSLRPVVGFGEIAVQWRICQRRWGKKHIRLKGEKFLEVCNGPARFFSVSYAVSKKYMKLPNFAGVVFFKSRFFFNYSLSQIMLFVVVLTLMG